MVVPQAVLATSSPARATAGEVPEQRADRMRRLGGLAGIAVMVVAGVALLGWILGMPELRSVLSGRASVKVNTALALLACGAAVVLLARRRSPTGVAVLGSTAVGIGALTLAQYVLGVELGIDELLARDPVGDASPHPGRMAHNTAACLVLAGLALVVARHRRGASVSVVLAITVGTVGVVALIGYAAGVPDYLGVGEFTEMALPTAVATLLLGAGLTVAQPYAGIVSVLSAEGAGSAAARRLVPVAVLAPPTLAFLRWQGQVAGLYGTRVGIVLLAGGMMATIAVATVVVARLLNQEELARAEVELERRLQAQITTELAEGVCVTRWSDETVIYANHRFEEMVGVAPGALVGRSGRSIGLVGNREELQHAVRQAVRVEGRWSGELEFLRADGSRFWGQLTVSSFEHPTHGDLSVAVVADVTELHLAATALARQVAQFDSLLRAAADHSIIGTDLDGTIQVFNAGAERMLGHHAADLIGRETPAVIHDGDEVVARAQELGIAPGFEVFVHAARRGEVETRQWTYVRADGGRVPVSLTVSAMRDESGQPVGFIGIAQDISARLAAEAAQAQAEDQVRRSFDDAVIGMQVLDLDGRYLRVNDAFCGIVGYPREQLIGLDRERITHPDDVRGDREALRSLLDGTQRSYESEKRYLHGAGGPVWAALSMTLVRDREGRPEHYIAQVQDITERRAFQSQLIHMADHDPLTGLLNRRSFARELDGHVARVSRYGAKGAVLMIDLDNFKYFNDTQGHGAGDDLIIRVAHELREELRDSDVLARLGGDEFALLLPEQNCGEAERVGEKILARIRDLAMPATVGELRRVTASIGLACFDDRTSLSGDEMLVNADLAMYDAKEDGRDRVRRYRTEQHEQPRLESRMKWAEQISWALENDGFELMAQPIVNLRADGPDQYELLLRMRGRDGDLVPPGAFLYVAERLGLIREIDRWVTGRAIDLLAEEHGAGRVLRLEVNLSGHTVGDEELLALIERRLQETGVPPESLVFEITETAAIANIAKAAAFAQRLSAIGCKFALDDFGAGFGSFYYLKHLPFDYLKIDGEFVRHCATSETDRLLISAVVQIARGMGKHTIAEFVGDDETIEVLRRLGVDYGQGYHLGEPAPLETGLAARRPKPSRSPA